MKQRIYWVDTLKGLLIMLVIMGHRAGDGFSHGLLLSKVYIYSFHMPLFFFLSGYVFKIKGKSFNEFVRGKIKTLIVPLVFFSLIISIFNYTYYGIVLGYSESYNIESLIHNIIGIGVQSGSGIYKSCRWFLASLFVIQIIMYLIIKILHENIKKIAVFSMVLVVLGSIYVSIGPNLPWMLDTSLVMLFFFSMGYISSVKQWKVDLKIALLAAVIHLSALWLNYKILGLTVDPMTNRFGNIIYFMAESVGGIIVMIFIAKKIKKCKFVNYIGKNSLVFYGFLDIMAFIPDILVYNIFHIELEKIGMWNIVIWLMYAIIICVTIIPINVLLNNHFKFLIGKTSKR